MNTIILLVASPQQSGVTVASRLLAAIGAKLLGSNGSLEVGKWRALGAPISRSVQLAASAHLLAALPPLCI